MPSRPSPTLEEMAAFYNRSPETKEQRAERRRIDLENSRLHMLPPLRILIASVASFGVGAALGISHGGKMAGLRFRAEHAHKLPATPTGWFMYHKSKNYTMMKEATKEGLRMGFRVSFWTTAMFSIETLYDSYRQSNDFINTVLASLTVAGGFSLWSMCKTVRVTCLSDSLLIFFATCRQIQSRHDRPRYKVCACRRSRIWRLAGCHGRGTRSAHWLH